MTGANDDVDRLRILVERIERLNSEIAGLQEDRRDIYAEAKSYGFSVATIRKLIQRRAMAPEDRAEADNELEVYECALNGDDGAKEALARTRPDAQALAQAILAEQIEGIEDAEQAEALIAHISFLLELRAEIALLRGHESDRKKLAKAEGFDAKQLALAVRWFEKCAKHGEEVMRAGEAVFGLYRATYEKGGGENGAGAVEVMTSDPKLAAAFGPKPKKTTVKERGLSAARFAAQQTRRALDN